MSDAYGSTDYEYRDDVPQSPRRTAYDAPWSDSGNRESQLKSAAAVLRFAMESDDVLPVHRDRLINDSLWFVTEADGKYTTRYRSRGAIDLDRSVPTRVWRRQLRHDHVVTRKSLADRIRAGEDPSSVLAEAEACVVTVEEHTRLGAFDKTHDGWARYAAAGVEVIDTSTGEVVSR